MKNNRSDRKDPQRFFCNIHWRETRGIVVAEKACIPTRIKKATETRRAKEAFLIKLLRIRMHTVCRRRQIVNSKPANQQNYKSQGKYPHCRDYLLGFMMTEMNITKVADPG